MVVKNNNLATITRKLHKPPTFAILVAQNTYFSYLLQETPTLHVFVAQRSKSTITLVNRTSDSNSDRQGPLSVKMSNFTKKYKKNLVIKQYGISNLGIFDTI
jgi:hypothetical protein